MWMEGKKSILMFLCRFMGLSVQGSGPVRFLALKMGNWQPNQFKLVKTSFFFRF